MTKPEKRKAAALEWARMASHNPKLSVAAALRFTRREWPELAPAFSGKACLGTCILGLDPDKPEYDVEDPKHPSEWQTKPRRGKAKKTARAKKKPPQNRPKQARMQVRRSTARKAGGTKTVRSAKHGRNPLIVELDLADDNHKVSAGAGGRWIFERVTTPNIATVGGSEKQLEDWLIDNWDEVDLGPIGRLRLLHRQVRPSQDGAERIDLVAWRDRDKRWLLLELKAKTCSPGDLTQLQAYRNSASRTLDVPLDRVHGILIAPEFHKKVREAAGANKEIHLLRYARKPRRS